MSEIFAIFPNIPRIRLYMGKKSMITMRRLNREAVREPVARAFVGRSVQTSGLIDAERDSATRTILETVRKMVEHQSAIRQYNRMLRYQSFLIASKRSEAGQDKAVENLPRPLNKEHALNLALRSVGLDNFEVREKERNGDVTIFIINYDGGKYKLMPLNDSIMKSEDPVAEVEKRIRATAICNDRDTRKSNPSLDITLVALGFSPNVLKERMVTFDGYTEIGGTSKKLFTYLGNDLCTSFHIPAEIVGKNLIVAIDLKIRDIHRTFRSPYLSQVLEAQSYAFDTPARVSDLSEQKRKIAISLNHLVYDERTSADMVPQEYLGAYIALRKLHNKIVLSVDREAFSDALSIVEHPAYRELKEHPEMYEGDGRLNKEGLESFMKCILSEKCPLSETALRNLASAYGMINDNGNSSGWALPTLRNKYFLLTSSIRRFVKENYPEWGSI